MRYGYSEVDNYKVIIQCCTYNQSQYIEETLNGFVIQKTNFPYVCCIYDDASNDGEQNILKRWIENHCEPESIHAYNHPLTDILMAVDKDNPNCIYAIHLQKVNTWGKPEKQDMLLYWERQGKYIAFCEGDDYWIDSLKLQKQVDFLDKNIDVSMVFSSCHVLSGCNYIDNEYFAFKGISNKYYSSDELYAKWIVPTASIMYRFNCYKAYYDERIYARDIVLVLSLAEAGKVFGMADYMTVYRLNNNGMTITRELNISDDTFVRDINHTLFLKETFKSVSSKLYNRKLSISYEDWLLYKFQNHKKNKWRCFNLSLRYDFLRAIKSYTKRVLKSLLFPKILEMIRTSNNKKF